MSKWPMLALENFFAPRSASVNPANHPEEVFNLYSIPAYDSGVAEPLPGSEIGSSKKSVQEGDLLLARIVPHIRRAWVVGESATRRSIASTEWIVFRHNDLLPEYLRYLFLGDNFRDQFMQTVSGVGGSLLRANAKQVGKIRIPVPPLPEQERIVGLLDKADAIRKLRAKADQRTAELIPALFHEMFGDPLTNPMEWPVRKVEEVGRVQLGRQRAPKYQTGHFTRPYIRVANVLENLIDTSSVHSMDFDSGDYEAYRLRYGDILLNEGQSTELVGRPAMWRGEIDDCCFQNTLVRFQANPVAMMPEFALSLFLALYRAGEFALLSRKTSNVAHLGSKRFASMEIILPPLALQEEFRQRVTVMDALGRKQLFGRSAIKSALDSITHYLLA